MGPSRLSLLVRLGQGQVEPMGRLQLWSSAVPTDSVAAADPAEAGPIAFGSGSGPTAVAAEVAGSAELAAARHFPTQPGR